MRPRRPNRAPTEEEQAYRRLEGFRFDISGVRRPELLGNETLAKMQRSMRRRPSTKGAVLVQRHKDRYAPRSAD